MATPADLVQVVKSSGLQAATDGGACAAAIPIRPAPAACRRARGRVSRFGASLKDLGKKCFAFTKLDPAEIPGLKARL